MPPFAAIQTSVEAGVLTITLNRPDVYNAVNEDVCVELGTALRMAQREDAIRCIVLTGAGRAFCTGQDLKELARLEREPAGGTFDFAAFLRQRYNPLIVRMRTMEKPVVAALNGVAAGSGVSLALASDLRIAVRSATLLMAFGQLGLVPDCAATLTLIEQLGYARAAEMCFLGEPVTAEQALQWGLVNRVVDDGDLPRATQELAGRLAAAPTRALGLTKRAFNHAQNATLDEQMEYEALLQATAGRTADHREGLEAFLAKRPPRFTGS
jgi:2-(1,2-epoxy-1,2-dihydrophenyl)acetyl-CoA isomerase